MLLPNLQAQKRAKPEAAVVESPFAPFTHFSATMTGGLLKDEPRKIYRSGNLFRVDLDGRYHITDLARDTTWSVNPDRCTRVSGPDVHSFPFSAFRDYKVERSPSEDKETVDGHQCKMETVTFTPKEGDLNVKLKLWRAQDLRLGGIVFGGFTAAMIALSTWLATSCASSSVTSPGSFRCSDTSV